MYIYRGAFPGGNPPTTKFRIPMGTILEELTPEAGDPSGGTLIPEGKRIRFSADFIMRDFIELKVACAVSSSSDIVDTA
jgi:hypothetical protein